MTFVAIQGARVRIPSGWGVVPFKRVAALREDPDATAEAMLLSLKNTGELVPRADDVQPPSAEHRLRYWHVDPGDLVVNPMWLAGGAIGVSLVSGAVSPDYRVYSLASRVEPRFIHHLLRSVPYHDQYRLLMRAETTFDRRVTKDDFAELPVLVPPLDVQRAIVDLLDAETTRIDALVEKKRRMIGLVDERRRSVIDGLTVPQALGGTADAGFSTAWPVTALKRSAAFFSDGDWIESPFITSAGIRLIQTGNVGEGEYREQGFRYISDETFAALRCTEVFSGDVLISRLAGPVGCACLAPDLGTRMIAAVDVAIFRPQRGVDARFVVAYLSSARHLAMAELLARGTTMQRLSRSQVGDMPLPLPELHVQQAIVERVASATAALVSVKGQLERQIALLRERRDALITAVVTGQLDLTRFAA